MFSKLRQKANDATTNPPESRPSPSSSGSQRRAMAIEGDKDTATEPTGTQESSSSSSTVHKRETQRIEIDGRGVLRTVLFLDGTRFVSGGDEGKIRCWRVNDGTELGPSMQGGQICGMAVSKDGKWVVSGTRSGQVAVWDIEKHLGVTQLKGHSGWVYAVDVSPDGTKIATGAGDGAASVWSFSTGRRILGPLKHDHQVIVVKFSPDGRLLATATLERPSIRIYDGQDDCLLFDFPIQVSSAYNQSIAWASDSQQLFALSHDGNINHFDASTGTTHANWPILCAASNELKCMVLAGNGTFIAVSDRSAVSFWDTRTHQQIGSVIDHTTDIWSIAISTNYDIVIGGNRKITLANLREVLPPSSFDNVYFEQVIQRMVLEKADLEETIETFVAQDARQNEKIASLERVVQELHVQLSEAQRISGQKEASLNETINSLCADICQRDESSGRKIADLENTVQQQRARLAESQENDQQLRTRLGEFEQNSQGLHTRLAELEQDVKELSTQLAGSQQSAQRLLAESQQAEQERDGLTQILRVHEHKHQCEDLYSRGNTIDAAEYFLEIVNSTNDAVRANELIKGWIAEFTSRCTSKLETIGDEASNAGKYNKALAVYSLLLSFRPSTSDTVLIKWTSAMLTCSSVNDTLSAATKFNLPGFMAHQAICDVLERDGRITEAITCLREVQTDLADDTDTRDRRVSWECDFRQRFIKKLEELGNNAMTSGDHKAAIKYYSDALSLEPTNPCDIIVKCCSTRAALLDEALIDATKVIESSPLSYMGYKKKHVLLRTMGHHREAYEVFELMLSKLEQSSDPLIRELRNQYIDSTVVIRQIVWEAIRHMPRVLINTATGRLCDKTQQVTTFEKHPIYHQLRASMVTQVDHARIWREVKIFYRYAMFSHRWEDGEPLFQRVENIPVYELESSSPNTKLQALCKLVRALGLQWVWSDTCCIDRKDNVVLQESLVAMYAWYRGSSLTIVYLLGVLSLLQRPGDLRRSIWNTRAWTYQEYIAAETVQFYTEDWKPYLGLDMFNHKESPDIITEMQQAAGAFTQDLAILQPGLERVREKLYLASTRQTTLTEDAAYSLLGIFNAAIPVIYGEGNRAVGRLLEHILTGSGDVTILAWTGRAGSYNSCLPSDLTVYDELVPPHVPQPIERVEMENMVTTMCSSLPDLSVAVTLYDRFEGLPSPFFAASRLRLPSIVFSITELDDLSQSESDPNVHVYCATTSMLGDVEIETTDDLSEMKNLILIHPWIGALLDQEFSHSETGLDDTRRALRLVARLRQPFGALLLSPVSRVQYKRLAADALIVVRVREETSLTALMDGIRMVDIQ